MKNPALRIHKRIAAGLPAAVLAPAVHADVSYVFTDLGTLPSYGFSTAVDVDGTGNVAGIGWNIALDDQSVRAGNAAGYGTNNYSDLGDARAMPWTNPGGVVDLGTPEGTRSILGRADNNLGVVVGFAGDGSAAQRGFLWMVDGGMRDLRSLLDPADPVFGEFEAVVAKGISDAGQIVDTFTTSGVRRTHLLTPVPEPAAIGLMLAGGAVLGPRRLRSQATPAEAYPRRQPFGQVFRLSLSVRRRTARGADDFFGVSK